MQYDVEMPILNSYDELNALRFEAMELFERCLVESAPDRLQEFVEQKIVQEPPPLQALTEIGDDMRHRLMALRQYYFDVRNRALQALRDELSIDLGMLLPLSMLEDYHLLNPAQVTDYLRQRGGKVDDDCVRLIEGIARDSILSAARIHRQILIAEYLHQYLTDWVTGLHIVTSRRRWHSPSQPAPIQHAQ
jgi:hypothetical protein